MRRTETKIPFFLIWRFITRSNKWTLSLTIFLMAVAFINLVFITSLFNGIIEGSNDQIIRTYTGNIMVTPQEGQDVITNAGSVRDAILDTDGVTAASAETLVPASLKYKNIKGTWQILAVDPDIETTVTNISRNMIEGSYLSPDDTDGIIIGRQIAGGPDVESNAFSFKGAHAGDTVTLAFDGISKDFTIRGVFNVKFTNTDLRAFITTRALSELMPAADGTATNIIVKTGRKGDEQQIINTMQSAGITGTFITWEDASGVMKSVTKSFLSINVLMTFVGVLIAAVTIFIVIYIDIMNRKRQIGILRAIGVKGWIIRTTYVLQTSVYSFFGVLLGTALFFGALVPYFNAHPFSLPVCDAVLVIDPADFVIRAEVVMIVAILSGLVPAIFVTRMKILHAILGK